MVVILVIVLLDVLLCVGWVLVVLLFVLLKRRIPRSICTPAIVEKLYQSNFVLFVLVLLILKFTGFVCKYSAPLGRVMNCVLLNLIL